MFSAQGVDGTAQIQERSYWSELMTRLQVLHQGQRPLAGPFPMHEGRINLETANTLALGQGTW